MDSSLFKYVEFLLPEYNCIVIPELGGFIINMEHAQINFDGYLMAPSCKITFNAELKHDDGILTTYISNEENISYKAASIKIKEDVKNIKTILLQEKSVHCNTMGRLILSKNNTIVFKRNENSVSPMYMGLSEVSLRKISEINHLKFKQISRSKAKFAIGATAAAVAAIMFLVVPSISSDNSQQAGFTQSISDWLRADKNEMKAAKFSIKDRELKLGKTHYIIVAGENSMETAFKTLNEIRDNEFANANIIEDGGRYRIHVANFENKTSADTFLIDLKAKDSKYEAAWIFSK